MKTNTTLLRAFRTLIAAITVAIHPQLTSAAASSPSELLEKGIYSEETKGDLDSAIAIYQQLVAEANINQSLAAQAQFRLGQCYLKKNRTAEATAAFEKLIRDYPNEKELVAKAREHLPGKFVLGPVPWVDGERLQLNIMAASGADIGTVEYRADLMQNVSGRKVWRIGARLMAGPQSVSTVDVEPDTFRPISSYWKHSMLGEVTGTYRAGEVVIQRLGTAQPTTVPVDGPVVDNEEAMHLMRRLPLQVGYRTTLPVITSLGGGTVISISLEVQGKETIEVPAGKFDCFKVHLGTVNQDFWLSNDAHRYLVKFEAGPITAALMSITQRNAGEPVAFHDEDTGVSFTAPPNWVMFRARHGQPEGQVLIRTLDPDADTDDGGMRLFATDSLSEAAQQSARAWIEEQLAKNKNVKVRPDSWKDFTIDGRPAVSCVADFGQGSQARVQFLARVLGSKYSELFVITCAPEKFDALKTQFDSILASYRTK